MIRKALFCMIAALMLAGCHRSGSEAGRMPQLTVSIEPLRALLEPLARGRFEVVCVMDRATDPETFEPSVSRRVAADASEAFFYTGAIPFETALCRTLPDSVERISMLEAVEPIYGTHDHCTNSHDHSHGMPDPHIWTSARNARGMAAAMAAGLTRLDPAGADIYAARLDSLTARLDSLDASVATRLAGARQRAFVVWHPSLSYPARDYGLRQVALGAEGKDFSVSAMRDAVSEAREAGAAVMFVQRGSDSGRARSVAADAGVRLVELDLMDPDLNSLLNTFADELARP